MALRRRISQRAVRIFKAIQATPSNSDHWMSLQQQLHRELGLEPWVWPAVASAKEIPHPEPFGNGADARVRYEMLAKIGASQQ
jgi:hypothetical protein